MAIAAVNKHRLKVRYENMYRNGKRCVSMPQYIVSVEIPKILINDIGRNEVSIMKSELGKCGTELTVELKLIR